MNINKGSIMDQEELTTFINNLVQSSNDSLTCGPFCQKEKRTSELKQIYLDAQTNEQTAPFQYETAKKNYYVYKDGEASYNKMRFKELEEKADKIIQEMEKKFKEQIKSVRVMNSYLESELINSQNTIELLKDYEVKDLVLEEDYHKKINEVITNDRKSYYENQEIERIKFWSKILTGIYFICLILLSLEIIFSDKLKIPVKFIILLIFYLYPFVIFWIMGVLYKIYQNLVKTYYYLFPQNTYLNI